MANIRITYARYYPVQNGTISDEQVQMISSGISEELGSWAKFIYKHPENDYLDLVFESKSILDYTVFKDEKILEHFHIWVRISDEGGKHDVICFKSKSYGLNTLHGYSDVTFRHYKSDTWNYVNMCLYGADSFSVHMKQFDVRTVKQFIHYDSEYMDLNIQVGESWKTTLNIVYFKTNYRYLDPPANSEPFAENFYEKYRGEGSLTESVCGDSRLLLHHHFIAHTQLNDEFEFERIDENILKVCLWKNDIQVHEWEWSEEKGEWEESCSADWDHCMDPEYLRFLTLYEHKLI
ncbi:hypothetical protein D3C87_65040 [compost metagenome]